MFGDDKSVRASARSRSISESGQESRQMEPSVDECKAFCEARGAWQSEIPSQTAGLGSEANRLIGRLTTTRAGKHVLMFAL